MSIRSIILLAAFLFVVFIIVIVALLALLQPVNMSGSAAALLSMIV